MDIKYIHIPELGISSKQRKAIKDKKILFQDFRTNLTSNGSYYLNKIIELAITYKRIALTCFEANPEECHRSIVAKIIYDELPQAYKLENL